MDTNRIVQLNEMLNEDSHKPINGKTKTIYIKKDHNKIYNKTKTMDSGMRDEHGARYDIGFLSRDIESGRFGKIIIIVEE